MALVGSEKSYTGWFFALSQIFVLLTLYSLYDEWIVRRPWKEYQEEFNTLQRRVAEKEIDEARLKFSQSGADEHIRLLELELEKAGAAKESDEYAELAEHWHDEKIKFDDAEMKVKFKKSILDSLFYKYKHALQSGHHYEKEKQAYDELDADIRSASAKLATMKADLQALADKSEEYDQRIKNIGIKISELKQPVKEAKNRLANVDARVVEIDIKQIVVEDFGKQGNIYWGRVDRCQTCHFAVEKPGFEDTANAFGLTVVKDDAELFKLIADKPESRGWAVTERKRKYLQTMYGTHPRSQELFSNHPIEQFGCTSCHGGDGRGLIIKGKPFGHEDKVHATHEHAIEPLLRGPQIEANCLACHQGQIQLAGAKNLSRGAELFVQLGCQNCHAVDGYDKLFRVGPELNKVAGKVQAEWLVDWIKNPFNYMPNSRMPNFALSDDDALAVASYLTAKTEKFRTTSVTAPAGNAANGEKLFNTVGCTGCHSAKSDPQTYAVRSRGPNLARLSAKVRNSAWVYDWIRDPKNYAGHARMPDLRLTDTEAGDMTAYLMGLNPGYKSEIAKRSATLARKINTRDQQLIAAGEKIITNRGCYSCHLIKGFENGERIAPNLTAEALKETFEFDFGDALKKNFTFTDEFGRRVAVTHFKETPGQWTATVHANARSEASHEQGGADKFDIATNIEEKWQSWIRNKLRFPATMYKHERIEQKMPNFNLSDEELDALLVFLKAMTFRNVPPTFNASPRPRIKNIIAGQQLMAEKNCFGCHVVGEFGGDILAKIDEVDHGEFGPMTQHYPPELTHVGVRIRPEWLAEYLKDPRLPYRPAVTVRMPTFGFDDAQVNTLVGFFSGMSGVTPQLTETAYQLDANLVAGGKMLSSNDSGLACFACHLLNGAKPGDDPNMWAPDWKLVRTRVQPGFIRKWVQDPPHYQKFAVMPGFLNAPEMAMPGIMDGTSATQLNALEAYILSVGDTRTYKEMKDDRGMPTAPPAPVADQAMAP